MMHEASTGVVQGTQLSKSRITRRYISRALAAWESIAMIELVISVIQSGGLVCSLEHDEILAFIPLKNLEECTLSVSDRLIR